MSGNLAKVSEKSGNLCSQVNLIVAARKKLVTKLWCSTNTVTTVHEL